MYTRNILYYVQHLKLTVHRFVVFGYTVFPVNATIIIIVHYYYAPRPVDHNIIGPLLIDPIDHTPIVDPATSTFSFLSCSSAHK